MKKKTGWHFHISAAFQCLETNISTGSSQLPEKHRARLLSGACQASPRRTQSCNGVPLLSSGELSVCCDIRNLSIHYSSRPHSTPTGAAESHDSGSSVYQEDWHQHKEKTACATAGGTTERERDSGDGRLYLCISGLCAIQNWRENVFETLIQFLRLNWGGWTGYRIAIWIFHNHVLNMNINTSPCNTSILRNIIQYE